jgi:hypothetical protein
MLCIWAWNLGLKRYWCSCGLVKEHTGIRILNGTIYCESRYSDRLQETPGSIPGRGKRFMCTSQHPDRFWDYPSTVSNTYRGSFRRGKAAGAWSWPLFHLVPRPRMVELYLHSPILLQGLFLNYLSKGIILILQHVTSIGSEIGLNDTDTGWQKKNKIRKKKHGQNRQEEKHVNIWDNFTSIILMKRSLL